MHVHTNSNIILYHSPCKEILIHTALTPEPESVLISSILGAVAGTFLVIIGIVLVVVVIHCYTRHSSSIVQKESDL